MQRKYHHNGARVSSISLPYYKTVSYHIVTPLGRFSKLECLTTKRVSNQYRTEMCSESSRRAVSSADFCGTDSAPTVWRYRTWKIGPGVCDIHRSLRYALVTLRTHLPFQTAARAIINLIVVWPTPLSPFLNPCQNAPAFLATNYLEFVWNKVFAVLKGG